MATSPLRLQQGYGIGNALQPLPPFTIIANRAPTQQDRARLGTFWTYTAANNVYVLTSVTGGLSNWLTLSNGGAGIFTELTVNGPSTFNGNITQAAGTTALFRNVTINPAAGSALVVNGVAGAATVGMVSQSTFDGGTYLAARFRNLSAVAGSNVIVRISTASATGNAQTTYTRDAVLEYSTGIESATNEYVIAEGASLSAAKRLTISPTSGNLNVNGNTVIKAAQIFGALNVQENVADVVIYTESSRLAGPTGSRHLLCRQTSVDASPVIWATIKSRAGAVVNPGDLLFTQNFFARGNTDESISAKIEVTAGTPVPLSAAVPGSLAIWTTNGAGVLAQKLDISSEGQISIIAAGATLAVKGGAVTDFIGQEVLAAGTVTVNNTNITANDKIFLSVSLPGGTQGFLSYAIAAGVSFTITSTNALDTSTVEYFIVRQI